MVSFKFDLEKQGEYYNLTKFNLENQFFQKLNFYILPKMPAKFRNKVVYLPETFEPNRLYNRHRLEVNRMENEWKKTKKVFLKEILKSFPKINNINILISPKLYGSLGSFRILKNKIVVSPGYDRKINDLQKLIINAVVSYYNQDADWAERQSTISDTQNKLTKKSKSMVEIINTEFSGKLAEESSKYLEKLNLSSKKIVLTPNNLTKKEEILFNLLVSNINKLVSNENIGNSLWGENLSDRYSEYAITKLIERLRRKTLNNNIQAQRGYGYIFHI